MCDLLVIGVPFSVDIIGVDETLVVSVAAVVTDLMFVDASGSSCDVVVHWGVEDVLISTLDAISETVLRRFVGEVVWRRYVAPVSVVEPPENTALGVVSVTGCLTVLVCSGVVTSDVLLVGDDMVMVCVEGRCVR